MAQESIAYPSLPSIKIGGMKNKRERVPLYGSIRFCVTGKDHDIYTKTRAELLYDGEEDIVIINGKKMEGKPQKRVEIIFSKLKEYLGINDELGFLIESENIGYPTGGGLASSAAGAAAAAESLYSAVKKEYPDVPDLPIQDLSRIARYGSSSAIGSVVGAYSEVVVSGNDAWGEKIGEKDALPDIEIIFAQIKGGTESDKIHGAMLDSRYLDARIKFVEKAIPSVKTAIQEGDTESFIKLTHEDTKNYHGALLDQGIITFEADTLPVFRKIEELNREGLVVGCSIAGGPVPIVLSTRDEIEYVIDILTKILPEERWVRCKVANSR